MIIECQACHARFRLDESRIKGKGARVRCRKCGESILVMKDAVEEPEAALGQFDLTRAVEESMGRDDGFLDLGAVAPPQPANEPLTEQILPPPVERPESAPPVYETGIDPFAADEAMPLPVTEPALMPPSPELDDVDLAFEQFLAGNDDAFTLPAPGPELLPDLDLAPREQDGLLDLSAPDSDVPLADTASAEEAPAPFLLNDAETLAFIGNEPLAHDASEAMTPADSRAEAFGFQLDEESMRVPDGPASSPFIHTAAHSTEAETGGPPVISPEQTHSPRQQPLPQELLIPKSAVRNRPAREPREPFIRPGVALLVALFLLLAGAGGYLGFTENGRATLRRLMPAIGPLLGSDNAARKNGPQFDVRNLIGYYDNTAQAGRMFVIKGQVANMGQITKGRIRIHAALLDNTNRTLAEKTVYAGNVLGGEALRVADKETIEKTLSSPFGEKLANLDVAPGKSVPFMVVFLGIPEGIDAYRLEAKEGD